MTRQTYQTQRRATAPGTPGRRAFTTLNAWRHRVVAALAQDLVRQAPLQLQAPAEPETGLPKLPRKEAL